MKKLVLAVIALGFSVGVNAACDTKSLKGDYNIGVMGGNASYTCAIIGVVTFDGKGALKSSTIGGCGVGTGVVNETGVYSLSANCMGTATFLSGSTINFVIDKNMKVGQLFLSMQNSLVYGNILKQ